MLRRFAPYRVFRVALAVALVVPRYFWLIRRGRGKRPPEQAAWDRVHRRAAAALHSLGIELAGMFVKVCQIVGARADVFPAPFIEELSRFHDRAPARPFAALSAHVERELGRDVGSVFSYVDAEPLAAASLAQVHRVKLCAGDDAVLKIQYPEIERLARVDLASLRWVVRIVARMQRRLDLKSLVEEVAKFIALELDFEREARSTERVRQQFLGSDEICVPRVYSELSTRRVLVLEYLEGVQITNFNGLAAAAANDSPAYLGGDRRLLAERIGRGYAKMIFEHGFFHGDPHPGNILVLRDGRIGLLDFGLAKELPAGFAVGVARMLTSVLSGDTAAVVESAKRLGFDVDDADGEAIVALLRMLLGEKQDVSLMGVLERTSIKKIPDDFGLIVRALILLNGLSHQLAPGERVIQQELGRALSGVMLRGAAAA